MTTPPRREEGQPRRRRDSRQRILDAASSLLEGRRWNDLRLEDVMAEAGLSRTAFYRHFADRDRLLVAMLEQVRAGVDGAGSAWKSGRGDPVDELCVGLDELTGSMVEHGRLMQAIADVAAHDPAIRAARQAMIDDFSKITAERIRVEVEAGRSRVRDPQQVATALVQMNEACLVEAFGHPPFPDRDRVTATIQEVWVVTIYGREAFDATCPPEGQRSR